MNPFFSFIISLSATMALIPPLIRMAPYLSAVDQPNERKVHATAIPRVGGVAMVIGVMVSLMLSIEFDAQSIGLLIAVLTLLVFGFLDDTRDLDYRLKFLGQFIAATVVVLYGGVRISVMPLLGFDPVSELVSVPFTILFIVGITNAINLADGLDGLAGGVSIISLAAIGVLTYLSSGTEFLFLVVAIIGGVFGFLRYNTYPARIFMGDTGSQFLGFMVALLSILLTQEINPALNPALPLLLIGLPVVDTLWVMGQRIRAGRSPFSADKNHTHHKLISIGLAHYEAVASIYMAQIVYVMVGYLVRYESDVTVLLAYIATTVLLVLMFRAIKYLYSDLLNIRPENKLTGLITKADGNAGWRDLPFKALGSAIPIYYLSIVLRAESVSIDVVYSGVVLAVLLFVRLVIARSARFIPLRFLLFATTAFILYLGHVNGVGFVEYSSMLKYIIGIGFLSSLFFAIRYSKDGGFQTTPTDLIVIFLVVLFGVLAQRGVIGSDLMFLAGEIVILFYAVELVLKHMKRRWNTFTVGMLINVCVLGAGVYHVL